MVNFIIDFWIFVAAWLTISAIIMLLIMTLGYNDRYNKIEARAEIQKALILSCFIPVWPLFAGYLLTKVFHKTYKIAAGKI